jgi:hypothetical protein
MWADCSADADEARIAEPDDVECGRTSYAGVGTSHRSRHHA